MIPPIALSSSYQTFETSSVLDRHDAVTTIFGQLEGITGIIARYSIMENLYRQTRGVSLESDYEAALIELCCKILSWFNLAFVLCDSPFDPQVIATCVKLWTSIRESDHACQGFHITVEAESEGSTSDMEIGYVSDEPLAIL